MVESVHSSQFEEDEKFRKKETQDKAALSKPKNKIFEVEDAIPPEVFDQPYSELPSNVSIKQVTRSVCLPKGIKVHNLSELLRDIHVTALISDSFWYIICNVFNQHKKEASLEDKKRLDAIEESLLDRLSANFVSFFVDFPEGHRHDKNSFFKIFYDIIAQTVFFSLYFAYPKSRSKFKHDIITELLEKFSLLFNGMIIKKYNSSHWTLELGTGNVVKQLRKKYEEEKRKATKLELDEKPKSKVQARTQRQTHVIRYSPLFERYFKAQRYETVNVVKPWNVELTNRTQNQHKIDEKFKRYLKISRQIYKNMKEESEKIKKDFENIDSEMKENERECIDHINRLEQKKKEILENSCSEYANYLVSMFNKNLEKIKSLDTLH